MGAEANSPILTAYVKKSTIVSQSVLMRRLTVKSVPYIEETILEL